MKNATFNNLISLEYPDDFVELSEKENQKYFSGDLKRLSFHNKEKHIILSISKSKDSFLVRFFNLGSILIGATSNLENNLKDYKRIEEYESDVFDRPSLTDCFEYMANDQNIKQYGELTVFKVKRAFYIIYCLCRYEDKETAQKIFQIFKESFKED